MLQYGNDTDLKGAWLCHSELLHSADLIVGTCWDGGD